MTKYRMTNRMNKGIEVHCGSVEDAWNKARKDFKDSPDIGVTLFQKKVVFGIGVDDISIWVPIYHGLATYAFDKGRKKNGRPKR